MMCVVWVCVGVRPCGGVVVRYLSSVWVCVCVYSNHIVLVVLLLLRRILFIVRHEYIYSLCCYINLYVCMCIYYLLFLFVSIRVVCG